MNSDRSRDVPDREATGDDELLQRLAALEAGQGTADLAELAALLAHASKSVRRQAASALAAALGRGEVDVAAARSVLSDEAGHSRWGAAFALSRAGLADADVTRVALAALDDDDGDVRWAAAAIVTGDATRSGPVRAELRDLVSHHRARVRKMALLCLRDCGERDGALFRSALADGDPYVRMAALTSLARGGHRDPESLAALSASADGDGDDRVRRAATAVLRRLRAPATE